MLRLVWLLAMARGIVKQRDRELGRMVPTRARGGLDCILQRRASCAGKKKGKRTEGQKGGGCSQRKSVVLTRALAATPFPTNKFSIPIRFPQKWWRALGKRWARFYFLWPLGLWNRGVLQFCTRSTIEGAFPMSFDIDYEIHEGRRGGSESLILYPDWHRLQPDGRFEVARRPAFFPSRFRPFFRLSPAKPKCNEVSVPFVTHRRLFLFFIFHNRLSAPKVDSLFILRLSQNLFTSKYSLFVSERILSNL